MKEILVFTLKLYKKNISPIGETFFGKACRFTPTCSEYTITSLERFGTLKGLKLGITRFLRCHPWGGYGYDPVPTK